MNNNHGVLAIVKEKRCMDVKQLLLEVGNEVNFFEQIFFSILNSKKKVKVQLASLPYFDGVQKLV